MNLQALAGDAVATLVLGLGLLAMTRGWISARTGWIGLILAGILIFSDTQWRIHSHHGLVHTGLVTAMVNGMLPPENPFLAGTAVGYPYGLHALVAGLGRALPLSAPDGLALANLLALGSFALVLDRASRLLGHPTTTRIWICILALLGTSAVARGLFSGLLYRVGVPTEGRTIPILKFFTVNANGVGMMFLACLMWGILSVWHRTETGLLRPIVICLVGMLGVAFIYPVLAPVAWLMISLAWLTDWFAAEPEEGRLIRALAWVGTLVMASLVAIPWFEHLGVFQREVASGEASTGSDAWFTQWVIWASVFAIPALLIFLGRELGLLRLVQDPTSRWLLATTVLLSGAFLTVPLPSQNEYKWLMAAQLPLAVLIGPFAAQVQVRHPVVAFGVVLALAIPSASWMGRQVAFPWRVLDPATLQGRTLVHDDADERALHAWLRSSTETDAVLLDRRLSLPAFTGRSLFVALDLGESRAGTYDSNGVGLTAKRWLLEIHGSRPETVEARAELVMELLQGDRGPTELELLADKIQRSLPRRTFYLIIREPDRRHEFDRAKALQRVFETPSAGIYRLSEAPAGISTS